MNGYEYSYYYFFKKKNVYYFLIELFLDEIRYYVYNFI